MSSRFVPAVLFALLLPLSARSQEAKSAAPVEKALPSDVVDDDGLLLRIEAACEVLRQKGALRTIAALQKEADGKTVEFPIVPARTEHLPLPRLRSTLMASTMSVLVYYHCEECGSWHASASTGFAVAADGLVATCFHVLHDDGDDGDEEHQPFLVVADCDGRVDAVTEVVAASKQSDLAVLRCTNDHLVPLPLRYGALAGEPVFCLSNPDHLFATFTAGVLSRRYVVRGPAPGTEDLEPVADVAKADSAGQKAHPADPVRSREPGRVFLAVTCEFATGSSGAPIVDACGNVLGIAQSTSSIAVDPSADVLEVQMVVRTAVPSEAIAELRRR
ncbi:MAG: serine protease [Planctomycetota bacterium]